MSNQDGANSFCGASIGVPPDVLPFEFELVTESDVMEFIAKLNVKKAILVMTVFPVDLLGFSKCMSQNQSHLSLI